MFTFGPVTFHLYGLMIGLGVLAGAWAASRKDKKIWDSLVWVIGGGIIGARLYHVVDFWEYYRENLAQIPAVWQGGMGIYGGILGGVLGLWIYVKKRKGRILPLLDAGAVGLPLGQAIGRLGNFFNQELYGLPTNLPWGIYIKPENRLLSVWEYERFQPLWLYEAIWNLIIFIIIIKIIKIIPMGKGKIFAAYLGLYGLGRFFLEFLRIEAWIISGVNVAQAISLGLILMAFSFIMGRK